MAWKEAVVLCASAATALALGGCEPPLRPVVVGRATPTSVARLPVVRDAKDRTGGLAEVLGGRRPVVLAFFTTWCPVSKPTLNALDRIAAEYRDGVTAIAVGMDAESPEITQFVAGEGSRVTIAVDHDGSVAKEMSVPTMPMIFVLDGAGVIRYAHAGYHGEEDDLALREEVTSLTRRSRPEVPAPELPEIEEAPRVAMQEPPKAAVPPDVERLKARATEDLTDGVLMGAFNLAQLATTKAPADAEAWLILAAANTAMNDRDAARAAYEHCVANASGPRVSECVVLLATF